MHSEAERVERLNITTEFHAQLQTAHEPHTVSQDFDVAG